MVVDFGTNKFKIERHFLMMLDALLKQGYALKDYTPNALHARFASQKGDFVLRVSPTLQELHFNGIGINPHSNSAGVSTIVMSTENRDPRTILSILAVTKPPTGLNNLSAFMIYILDTQTADSIKVIITQSKNGAKVDVQKHKEINTFTFLNGDDYFSRTGLTNLIIRYQDKELYFVSPSELLAWVTPQEKCYI